MNDTHRTAFEWLMKEQDGQLDEASRQALHQHLAECSQCRQDFAILQPLALAAREQPLPQPAHPVTGRLIADACRSAREQQTAREPFLGAAWGAAVFVVLILIGLTNDFVRPNVAIAAVWLPGQLGQGAAAAEMSQASTSQWLWMVLIFLSGILTPLLVGCAGVAFGKRQAYNGWLAFLLAGTTLGLGLFCFSITLLMGGSGILIILLIPFLTALLELLLIHLWTKHEQWTWFTYLLIGIYFIGMAAFVAVIWERQAGLGSFWPTLVTMTLFVALPAFTWLVWEWRKPWRWLGSLVWGLMPAGVLLSFLVYSPFVLARYPWIESVGAGCSFLWVLVAVTLAGRVVYNTQVKPKPQPRSWVTAVALVLLFTSLFADIQRTVVQNSVAEDPYEGAFMIWFACAAAMTPAVTIAWKLQGRRLWASLALICLFTFGLIPALVVPDGTAQKVTERRAAQVNQAVLRFYSQNQHYPASLAELEPGFLWQVPAPITSNGSTWCYDGDASYYRLGYFDSYQFTHPDQINLKAYAQAGEPPAQPSACQLALEKLRR
jgi:hypothetical protein